VVFGLPGEIAGGIRKIIMRLGGQNLEARVSSIVSTRAVYSEQQLLPDPVQSVALFSRSV
jgi:hypothetical protein